MLSSFFEIRHFLCLTFSVFMLLLICLVLQSVSEGLRMMLYLLWSVFCGFFVFFKTLGPQKYFSFKLKFVVQPKSLFGSSFDLDKGNISVLNRDR